MHLHWTDVTYLFVGIIIPTYNILEWIGRHFGKTLKRLIVRSDYDRIVWIHYKKHAANQGHAPVHPRDCTDDDCIRIGR